MATDSAVSNDKTPVAKAGSDAHQPPDVTAKDHADFHASVAAAAAPRPDVVIGGQLDLSGDVYGQGGDPKSAAKLADGTATKSSEGIALNAAAPLATDKIATTGADRAPEVPNGADSARALPVRPGDAPPTRSDKVTYKPDDPDIKDIQPAKDRLLASENGMSPELKASMAKHMDDLEHRLPPATAKQIAGVYDATTKLLTDPDKTSPLTRLNEIGLPTTF